MQVTVGLWLIHLCADLSFGAVLEVAFQDSWAWAGVSSAKSARLLLQQSLLRFGFGSLLGKSTGGILTAHLPGMLIYGEERGLRPEDHT